MKGKRVLAAAAALCLLAGCSKVEAGVENAVSGWVNKRLEQLNEFDDIGLFNVRVGAVFDACKEKDHDALYQMFSSKAQEGGDGLDEGIDALIALLGQENVTYERLGMNISDDNGDGTTKKQHCQYNARVWIEETEYFVSIGEVTIDEETPENVGLHSITAFPASGGAPSASEDGIFIAEDQ